jgi:hypothetical protein
LNLPSSGFLRVDVPPPAPGVLASYADLPADPYCPGRWRRFSQYRMGWVEGAWASELLEHRPHVQSRRHNNFVGGVLREFEPVLADLTGLIDFAAQGLGLATDEEWQVDLHQWRTACEPGQQHDSVPEGIHRDGHAYAAVFVLRREGVGGGVTQLFGDDHREPLEEFVLESGEGILFDDQQLAHNTTAVHAAGAARGERDIVVIDFNPWAERRYGAEFEARVVS